MPRFQETDHSYAPYGVQFFKEGDHCGEAGGLKFYKTLVLLSYQEKKGKERKAKTPADMYLGPDFLVNNFSNANVDHG